MGEKCLCYKLSLMKTKIRNFFAWMISNYLIFSGAVKKARQRAFDGEYILSFYFHNPTKKEFEYCLKWLIKNKFTFLKVSDLEAIRQGKVPFPKGAVLLTVDDGWKTNEENIVDVANQYGIPVTIFIATEPVEQGAYWWSYLQDADLEKEGIPEKRQLKKSSNESRMAYLEKIKSQVHLNREAMTKETVESISNSPWIGIGGHTHTHPILINCNEKAVYEELNISKQKLESWIGKEVDSFAYPNGDFGEREKRILKELHYRYAFSTRPYYLTQEALQDLYEIPRFGFLEGASKAENICRIVGVWHQVVENFGINPHPKKIKGVDKKTTIDSDPFPLVS